MDYDGQRICAVSDQMGAAQVCAFPRPHHGGPTRLGWYMTGLLPGWDEMQQFAAIREAWGYWEAVCGIEAVYYESSSEALGDLANKLQGLVAITVSGGPPFGSPGGVLADSMLPCGTIRIKQRYDTSERWVNLNQPGGNVIDLVRVACHELGHAIGLPHIASGNLLQPMYSTSIRKPQGGDIAEAVRRYGPRRAPAPSPVDPPKPPAGGGTLDRSEIFDLIRKALKAGAFVAKLTPTATDDQVIAFLQGVLDFLSGLPAGSSREEIHAAVQQYLAQA